MELNKNTPQFKVGDIVKILPRNGFSTNYYPTYIDGMLKYVGQLAIITDVSQYNCKINLDNGIYFWPFKALQLVTSETDKPVNPRELKNGDYIKITSSVSKSESYVYIFRKINQDKIYRYASYNLYSKKINVNPNARWLIGSTTEITYATEEEKKLLDEALLEQGFVWNNSTKQLDSIGLINVGIQPVDFSSFQNSIQKINAVTNIAVTNLPSSTKGETQTETELNLFPTKKHYQLNFNY